MLPPGLEKILLQSVYDVGPGPVVVAVSGGPDSIALLHAMRAVSYQKQWQIEVAHVQHNLRGADSFADQNLVEATARTLGLNFHLRTIRLKKSVQPGQVSRGLEQSARRLRYRALAGIAKDSQSKVLFVAHQKDDVAETLLLNLIRGAGSDGLCGMERARPLSDVTGDLGDRKILLVRPFLSVPRSNIMHYLKRRKAAYRIDSTNHDLSFRRNWVRHKLIPTLRSVQPKITDILTNTAEILRIQKSYFDSLVDSMKKQLLGSAYRRKSRQVSFALPLYFEYHIALRHQFLHRLFPWAKFAEIRAIDRKLEQNQPLTSPEVDQKVRNVRARSLPMAAVKVPGLTVLRPWNMRIKTSFERGLKAMSLVSKNSAERLSNCALFDFDKIRGKKNLLTLMLRAWRPGDRFRPFGLNGSKKLQDFFTDIKMPVHLRKRAPLLVNGKKILWVIGYRTEESGRIDEQTKTVLRVQVQKLRAQSDK